MTIDPTEPQLFSTGALLKQRFTKTPWLVENLLRFGGSGFVHGKPETGKSAFMMTLAVEVIRGGTFLGRFSCTPNEGNVVYLQFDAPEDEHQERVDKLVRFVPHLTGVLDERLHHVVMDHPQDLVQLASKPNALPQWVHDVRALDPVLILADSYRRLHNLDETGSVHYNVFRNAWVTLFGLDAACLIGAHDRKESKNYKGQSIEEDDQALAGSHQLIASTRMGVRMARVKGKQASRRIIPHRIRGPAAGKVPMEVELSEKTLLLHPAEPWDNRLFELMARNTPRKQILKEMQDPSWGHNGKSLATLKRRLKGYQTGSGP